MKTNGKTERWYAGVRRAIRAFTLIELLVVISVVLLLAALTVGGVSLAGRKSKEKRVQARLAQLVTALESYKAFHGAYPPDNPQDPAVNSLFYELTGVVLDRNRGEYRVPTGGNTITPAQVQSWFKVDGIRNAFEEASAVQSFVEVKSEDHAEISNPPEGVEVFTVPVPWPLNAAQAVVDSKPGLNPWRYRHPDNRSATNNPGSFELWAEFVDGADVRVISNWRTDSYVARPFQR